MDCYCKEEKALAAILFCTKCNRHVHFDCLKTGLPTPMAGDTFFDLICLFCGDGNEEKVIRKKLPWVVVVQLAMYNLQLQGGSKCGYFKWREHVCAYIDKFWHHFFGVDRKKGGNWYGTVAGTLSSFSPQLFQSGAQELKETGWWKLVSSKPPTWPTNEERNVRKNRKPNIAVKVTESGSRSRKRGGSLEAAIDLKARRYGVQKIKSEKDDVEKSSQVADSGPNLQVTPQGGDMLENVEPPFRSEHPVSEELLGMIKTEIEDDCFPQNGGTVFSESISALLGDSTDSDLDIDPCALSPGTSDHMMSIAPAFDFDFSVSTDHPSLDSSMDSSISILTSVQEETHLTSALSSVPPSGTDRSLSRSIKSEPVSEDEASQFSDFTSLRPMSRTDIDDRHAAPPGGSETETESETEKNSQTSTEPVKRKRKRRSKKIEVSPNIKSEATEKAERLQPMSVYEERCLLRQLQMFDDDAMPAHARRLKRKLVVRQLKRERGLPCFDLDATVNDALSRTCALYQRPFIRNPVERREESHVQPSGPVNILDRFQGGRAHVIHQQGASFLNKLAGTADNELRPIHSPYTARSLKPFIRRDYETVPLKLKLLLEIQAYPHRHDKSWQAPTHPPIDYCYVQPHHIPAINLLCREFFWPAIDMSECLQYPDFSCVVLYRKCVIGFAFMVPDVKISEAYITFIFTHPEWRRAGIAKFMLYHLIQTCMGKDVTLHVSANNSAMLLYQQFGFKAEQLVLDFYDKYLPIDSTECRHAYFLRMQR